MGSYALENMSEIDERTKIRFAERCRRVYGEEYALFFLLSVEPAPRKCPCCNTEAIKMLWLGDPTNKRGDSIRGKWYLWCSLCLKGIYSPLGTYIVPKNEPYFLYEDDDAVKRALPEGLQLIDPKYGGDEH